MKTTTKLAMAVVLGLSLLACNNKKQPNTDCPPNEDEVAKTELKKAEEEMKIDLGLQKKTLTIRDDILMLTADCGTPVDIKTICEKKEVICATLYAKNYKESGLVPDGTFKVKYVQKTDTMVEMQVLDKSNKVVSVLSQIYFEPEFSKIPIIGTLTITPDYNCIGRCIERLRPTFAIYQNMANVNCIEIRQCFACRCHDGTTAYVMMLFKPMRPYRCYLNETATMISDITLSGGGKAPAAIP